MPYDKILGAPAQAVLGLVAVVAVVALALALKQLLQGRKNGNGNGHSLSQEALSVKVLHMAEDIKRLEGEISTLRRKGHDHSSLVATAVLESEAALKRIDRLEDRVGRLEQDD